VKLIVLFQVRLDIAAGDRGIKASVNFFQPLSQAIIPKNNRLRG